MGNSTEITVEIGTDNPGSAVSSASLGTLSFVVSNGTSTQTFSGLSSAPDSTTFTNKTVSLTGIDTSGTAPNSTQRYTLQITHNTSVAAATTENWTLTINGFPTSGSPTARAIVSVVSYAGITNLTPFGPSAVAADVVVTPPSGSGTTVTFAASTTNAPAGATYQWVAESTDVNPIC